MPTKNPRLNVVLDANLYDMVEYLAKLEDKSLSVIAKELIEDAIERHEEFILSKMAMKRESAAKKTIPHDKAWK